MKKLMTLAGGLASLAMMSGSGWGADLDRPLCAVSGFNGKLEGAGGYVDGLAGDGGRGHGQLVLTVPLGCMFGFQVDAGAGEFNGSTIGSFAGHLFTRDPSQYLFGVYGQYGFVGGNEVGRVGAEGELYLNQFSFEGVVGYEDADNTGENAFTGLRGAFYVTDNLRFSAGFNRFQKVDAVTFGAEWQPADTGLPISLFVHGAVGDRDYATVFGGIRWHFGAEDKSLIRRHREDDPSPWGFEILDDEAETCQVVAVRGGGCTPVVVAK